MLKRLLTQAQHEPAGRQRWLDLTTVTAEISSEDPMYPIESALLGGAGEGWRAGEPGVQTVRLLFDRPQDLRWIHVSFVEAARARTQEFVLRWSRAGGAPEEIVRQQWNFDPAGAVREIENYEVRLAGATILELTINPDIRDSGAYATLERLQLA